MVGKSGAFVLSVPVDPDSTQYHPLFYRADACGGKSVQCTVAICFLLSINDFVEKLWKDVLDPFPIHLLRSFPDSTALSLRTVHYCCGYVPELGNH